MKCTEPNCPLTSTARDKPGLCRKHAEERKESMRPVRVILRIVDAELLLCFPDREVREGRMRAWGAAGPKIISESDYLFGIPPRSAQEQTAFKNLVTKYQHEFNVKVHAIRSWTGGQKRACWGLEK